MRVRHSILNTVSNPSHMLAFGMLAVSVLINTPNEIYSKPIVWLILYISGLLLFISIRFWWAAAVMVVINVIILGLRFPRSPNHSNLDFFISLFILSILAYKLLQPGFRIKGTTLSLLFRIVLVSVYFYTGFHKLNSDFLNSDVSCANHINQWATSSLLNIRAAYPKLLSQSIQYTTLFLELVLPWGLLWRRTRKFTAIIFLCFHFYLSFLSLANFGGFAAFMLFGCLYDFDSPAVSVRLQKYFRVYISFTLLAVAVLFILNKTGISKPVRDLIYGAVFNIGYLYFFVHFIRNYKAEPVSYNRGQLVSAGIAALLVSTWTLKAYAGFGNTANLTMFSNLITESSRSNHLLINTEKTKITGFEEDNVYIISLDPPMQVKYFNDYRLPVVEFKYIVETYRKRYPGKKLPATVIYEGDTLRISDLRTTQFGEYKWWNKYLYFRRIRDQGPNPCLW